MSTWTMALGAALVDFLWQGTLVGALLWAVLTLLRRRSPGIRYAVSCAALLTLAALPIVTLVVFAVSARPPEPAATALGAAVPQAVAVPQTMLPIRMVSESPRLAWLAHLQLWAVPIWSAGVILFSMRLAGAFWQALRLRRVGAPADAAALAAVARLAARLGIARPVRVVASTIAEGPAVIGWLRPVILLPPAAALGLTPQQLEAVLAHELAHIKRHDYLINLLQVIVETLFFYHPVVWWTSRQIRAERELCCDDIAVQSSGDAVGYARALTLLARKRIELPTLAAAAAGGPLMQRVQRLVGHTPREYGPSHVPALVAVAFAAGCIVIDLDWVQAFAETQSAGDVRFEVASVKPNNRNDGLIFDQLRNGRWTMTGYTAAALLRSAYRVQEFQIVGGPSWINTDRFDVVAKAPDNVPPDAPGAPVSATQLMLRALLAERFNLRVHTETREMPIFAIVLARDDGRFGAQLRRSADDCASGAASPGGAPAPGAGASPWVQVSCGTSVGPGLILAGGRTMAQIATAFSRLTNTGSSLNRLVVDRTGLEGTYDLELRFTPEFIPSVAPGGTPPGAPAVDPGGPSIFAAVQEQLGLKLDAQRGPVDVLVIDRVERPTPD